MKSQIELPPKLIPVFMGEARYRGAYGGRGSAKTKSFAKMAAVRAFMFAQSGVSGIILCGREFQNTLDESSFAEVKFAILSDDWLKEQFDVGERYIRTKCGRVEFSFQGLRRNIDSIKSKARILILWIDEAEPVSEECWVKVIPTVREQGSEIWVTWNPERRKSATNKRFRLDPPKNSKIVSMNWTDNPWFHLTALNDERLEDKEKRPDKYGHIWEGDYLTAQDGAYFASHITKAKEQGRISTDEKEVYVGEDPLMIVRLFVDIGGTGAKADNFVIWAAQFVGQSINVINHYEVQGQQLGFHLNWLREQGYTPDRAKIWLPHDGSTHDRVFDVSYESAFKKAGYQVAVITNQGKGAAMKRVEAVRNEFHRMHFDTKCEEGLEAIAWYHEKKDENREIGLGPDHDWSSHSADALGLMCTCYEPPNNRVRKKVNRSHKAIV